MTPFKITSLVIMLVLICSALCHPQYRRKSELLDVLRSIKETEMRLRRGKSVQCPANTVYNPVTGLCEKDSGSGSATGCCNGGIGK